MLLLSSDVSGLQPRLLLMLQCLGWGGTHTHSTDQPAGSSARRAGASSAGGLCSPWRCPRAGMSAGTTRLQSAGTTAGVALVAQVKLSHSILVTLWFMQSVRVPPGHEFTGCSGKVHGAQLGPWCSAQLSSLKAASLVFSAHVCQEHLCSFKRLAPCFFYFTPATTQAGSGSCWQVRTVTT